MNKRRAFYVCLSVLALFLLGTVVVLSSVTYYLAIDPAAYLSELDVPYVDNTTRWPVADGERIPRILHQTWKTDTLPDRWQPISQECREMMPDYEYMLWTDDSSRAFIAEHYPWFLDTFDNYRYPIQRADVIRYFVLHHYGGIYLDLDIGCLRPMDPLLSYPVILPKTIPVGVSNDLMFAEKGHPFLQQTINNLVTFDHSWVLNYPTVMFSTGPMFLSAQYGIYTTSHPNSALSEIRILPRSLYGKNAKLDEAPHSFFSHFYGSSWHADDAAFIGFLGTWGKVLMWVGLAVLVLGVVRLPKNQRRSLRRMGGYDVLLPRLSRSGRWYLPLGGFSLSSSPSTPQLPSPVSSEAASPTDADAPLLHFNVDPPSPTLSFNEPFAGREPSPITAAFRRVRNRVTAMASPREDVPMTPVRPRRRSGRGVLFFLPAIFTSSQDIEMESTSSTSSSSSSSYPPPPAYS
ncbi:MIPC synthase, partial [Ephemerocybe angulata]